MQWALYLNVIKKRKPPLIKVVFQESLDIRYYYMYNVHSYFDLGIFTLSD
jgi:hypothetical protein